MNRKNAAELFIELLDIISALRAPDGCPWDRKQTHKSLIPFMLEEANEVVAAIEDGTPEALAGELGDVLLQVALHSEIASEKTKHPGDKAGFDITTVLSKINTKLKRRHPHVFGNVSVSDAAEVVENWQSIKINENRSARDSSVLDSVSSNLPQLLTAQKYQERAGAVGFDWDDIEDVKDKIREEWAELNELLDADGDPGRIEEELGDFLFATVNLSRWLKISAEEALRKANRKFKNRFKKVESRIGGGSEMAEKSIEELDLVWDDIKKSEQEPPE